VKRARGKASKDGKSGWVTIEDSKGKALLEPADVWVCKQATALTPSHDISEGKPIRKVDSGETVEMIGEPILDEKLSLTRQKVKLTKDGKEGFITTKGNRGTSFVDKTDSLLVCKTANLPLEKQFESGSEALRTLDVGETVEILGAPKTETKQGANRLKIAGASTAGWVTLTPADLKRWAPNEATSNAKLAPTMKRIAAPKVAA